MMKWLKYILYTLGLVVAFLAGLATEWWNSPLNSHLCYDNGKELVKALIRETYFYGWGIIAGVLALILVWIAVGIWRLGKK